MNKTWTQLSPVERVALEGYGGEQGIYIRPSFVRMLKGDGNAAILLHHLLYWSRSDTAELKDGWFYHTTQRIKKYTGLNTGVQQRVRLALIKMGILEQELRGLPARNYYRINLDAILKALEGDNLVSRIEDSSIAESTQLDESDQQNTIVNTDTVNTQSNHSLLRTSEENTVGSAEMPGKVIDSGKKTRRTKTNVLGAKYNDFVDWVVKVYPVTFQGHHVAQEEAIHIANRLGDTYDDAKIPQASADIQEFIRGLENFIKAVASPNFNKTYVPSFATFAGMGYKMKDTVPHYKKWAGQTPPPDTSRRIQV